MAKTSVLKLYFKNKSNIIIFIILVIITIFGAYIRLKNLHTLSFWLDDGQTYFGTLGILKYGYPKLPSGNIMYHSIFSFYTRVIPSLMLGVNEVSLRLPSAIFGTLMIILVFLFTKELSNKYAGVLAAVVTSLNLWQIEFSREARYYSEFQFFYLLSVYFFYLGFLKDKTIFKILFIISVLITGLYQNQGFTLIFLFIPLFIYKGYKKFFKKEIMIPFAILIALIMLQIIQRLLYWNVGVTFFETTIETANPIIRFLSKFIASIFPNPFFYRFFEQTFSGMYYVFISGILLIILYIFINPIRNRWENWKNIYSRNNFSIKLPFNLFLIYFIFFSNVYFNGIGPMENQQRYIYYILPYLIIGYSYLVFDISRLFTLPLEKVKAIKNKIKKPNLVKIPVYFSISLLIFLLTINYINPVVGYKVIQRKDGDRVYSVFSPSSTVTNHFDYKSAGNYIYENIEPDDIFISMELLNIYPYTKKFDHWLWSGNLREWKPYDIINDIYYDKYFGKIVLRDDHDLIRVLNKNRNKNVWILTNRSIDNKTHIDPAIKNFLNRHKDKKVYTAKDCTTEIYYFPKDETGKRFFSITSGIAPKKEEVIKFDKDKKKLLIDFTNTETSKYLNYGWSEFEPHGRWSDSKEASLFISFSEKKDYKITMKVKPLLSSTSNQEIEIYFNGQLIGDETLSNPEFVILNFNIQKKYIKLDNYNSITFQFKYAKRPSELGISSDPRRLSVLFEYIEIEEIK